MQHVVEQPTPAFRSHSGALEVHQVCAWQDNFVWVIVDVAGRAAAVVDGPDAGGALELCTQLGVSLTTVLNTHTHPDHIGINADLKRRGLLATRTVIGSTHPATAIPGQTVAVTGGDTIIFGGVEGQVLLTEGHQNGHVSYLFEDLLFCGDTLFAGGCGYLFDGPASSMHASLQTLAALPPQTRVCCAHE
ncbi:MAG: MBL fold metallo-hydrolase, partial [Nannocystaceae bacterium]